MRAGFPGDVKKKKKKKEEEEACFSLGVLDVRSGARRITPLRFNHAQELRCRLYRASCVRSVIKADRIMRRRSGFLFNIRGYAGRLVNEFTLRRAIISKFTPLLTSRVARRKKLPRSAFDL